MKQVSCVMPLVRLLLSCPREARHRSTSCLALCVCRRSQNDMAAKAVFGQIGEGKSTLAQVFKVVEYAEIKRIREAQEREAAEKKRADGEAAARHSRADEEAAARHSRAAEHRARDAEVAARRENKMFLNGRCFKIGGKRIS
jgi:hypothetical protein